MPRLINQTLGFTLIEILIALAILSISLTAIIKSTSQNIKDTIYLQDKTCANWAAQNLLRAAKLGLVKLPPEPSAYKQETLLLNTTWEVRGNLQPSNNPRIRRIQVWVNKKTAKQPIIVVYGYLYVA